MLLITTDMLVSAEQSAGRLSKCRPVDINYEFNDGKCDYLNSRASLAK
jgi:hypothetical protein